MTFLNKYLGIFVLILLFGCAKKNNIYDSKETRKEIEILITHIIELDTIEVNYPDYTLISVLPKYIERKNKESFKPEPPPFADYLFPDLDFEFLQVKGVELTEKDRQYFKKQEESSQRIKLSDKVFGVRNSQIDFDYKSPYVYFSIPIFNAKKDVAFIRMGFHCGDNCGEGKTLYLRKIEGKWRILKERRDWVN